ncbi:MAG: glycosyltransferase [Chloroflexi bacterium]|nr:glycosyltransferase [Chloroflexota bacterium]
MNSNQNKRPHIVFYFSDTGGGHRSAAEAIIEALELEFPNAVTTEMVDFFKDYAPPPFSKLPEMYPELVKAPRLWGASFYATNGRARARMITSSLWPVARLGARRLVHDHPADLIVTVHPIANTFALRALGRNRPPFYTVVTDMVTTHALWFDSRSDHIFVPTGTARERALAYHIPSEKIEVVGLPVADRYCMPLGDKYAMRKKLGWPLDKPIALLVGGGDGMGPLGRTARAIDESGLDLGMVIVCGRNEKLKANLESQKWENPVFIYGFTRDLPDFMRAADVIVTKAGPGTISEALNANLPIILYAKLPGQEDGNVAFVESEGAGVWAPTSPLVVRALTRWLSRPSEREQVAKNAQRAARPDSARHIARALAKKLGLN